MKYNLLERNNSLTVSEQIFLNRGITNYSEYKSADELDIINWRGLKNMEAARDCLQNTIVNGKRIALISDSDADGSFSSGIFYNYFKKYSPYVYFHDGKEHGISDEILRTISDDIVRENIGVLVVPDAAVDDSKCKIIKSLGIDIIALDHHQVKFENKHAILINPLLDKNYPNPFLSGTAVTWKFLQCFSESEGNKDADKYIDMVAYSLLSDSMDIRTLENRAILNIGLNSVNNKMLLKFIEGIEQPEKEESQFSRKVETPTDVSFNVVPLINGLIRVGSLEEKKLMFNAFAEVEELYPYTHPKSKVEKMETVYEKTFRICKNAKAKQDREVNKSLEIIEKDIEENNRNRHKILFCKVDPAVDRAFTGLCAIKIASKYSKPVVMLREGKNDLLSGSIRNFDGSPLKNFKSFLESFGYTNWLAGHESAAGISLTKNQLIKLIPLTNEKLKDYSFEKMFDLDFEFKLADIAFDDEMLEELYDMRYFYGQAVQKSYFLLKDLKVNSDDIQFLGKEKKDTWKVKLSNNIDIIKFKIGENDIFYDKYCGDDFTWKGENLSVNVIGSLGMNEWNGRRTWQVIVEEYEFEVLGKKTIDISDDGW